MLGWSFVDTGEQFGHYTLARVGGRSAAALGPARPGQPAAWTLYLASDDAAATARAVTEHGGTVLVAPFEIAGNGHLGTALDASGAAFGIWQQGGMIGAEVYNEPGALIWEDARLTDAVAGQEFYASVLGWTYDAVPGAPDDYATFSVGGEIAGGIGGMMGAPDGTPSHWLPYFMVSDVDAAVAAAAGASAPMPATDTPFGRMAILVDPFGASFAVHGGMPAG